MIGIEDMATCEECGGRLSYRETRDNESLCSFCRSFEHEATRAAAGMPLQRPDGASPPPPAAPSLSRQFAAAMTPEQAARVWLWLREQEDAT